MPVPPEYSGLGALVRKFDAVSTDDNPRTWHTLFHQFLFFQLGCGNQVIRALHESVSKEAVIQPFQSQASHNRTVHSHRFENVWNRKPPAETAHRRPQQIIEAVDVDQVELPE